MHCPSCGNDDLTEIRLAAGGSPVTLHRCGRCEHQGWTEADGPVPLEAVLARVRG